MRLVYTFEQCDMDQPMIFLAGPTFRNPEQAKNMSWRNDVISLCKNENITLVIPEFRNATLPPNWNLKDQVEWQTKYLVKSNLILFWIPRNLKSLPAFTTNIQIGQWMHSGKIVVGAPVYAEKNDYLKQRMKQYNIKWYDNLNEMVNNVISSLSRKSKIWFTADTHFGQQRTLQLSKRPFANIYEMDNIIISNWNKCVLPQDTIYHLGDFGNANTIKQLSGKIVLIPGNYDTEEQIKTLKSWNPKLVVERNSDKVRYDNLYLIHEPLNGRFRQRFYLYGHVHSLSKVKRNGLNVGTDCHNFTPIDFETVKFYYDAITKHYDENVFIQQIKWRAS